VGVGGEEGLLEGVEDALDDEVGAEGVDRWS
jgi:hypothetical protein